MKKNITQTTKIIILGLMLGAGFALAWTAPTAAPTSGNTDAPINSSSVNQMKSGSFGVGPLAVFGKSWLWGDVSILPSPDTIPSNLYVSGKVGVGLGTVTPTESLDVVGKVKNLSFADAYIFASDGGSSNNNVIPSTSTFCGMPSNAVAQGISCVWGALDSHGTNIHNGTYGIVNTGNIVTPLRLCADLTGKLVVCPKGGITLTGYNPDGTIISQPFWSVPDGVFKVRITIVGTGVVLYPNLNPSSSITPTPHSAGIYDLNVLPGTTYHAAFNGNHTGYVKIDF